MRDFTNQWELAVKINGSPVTEYKHTDGLTYIEGRPGSKYVISIRNDSAERVCAIPAVDGLSVLDGNEAGLNSPGYIIDPFGTVDIPGWTLNQSEVASFEFGTVGQSYKVQSGRGASNVGVIGLMIFREKIHPAHTLRRVQLTASSYDGGTVKGGWYGTGAESATMSATADSCAQSVGQEMGTGFGEAQTFNTSKVSFTKRDPNFPDALIALYYDSARGLEKRGINVAHKGAGAANPFPGYGSTVGCAPPPGWVKK